MGNENQKEICENKRRRVLINLVITNCVNIHEFLYTANMSWLLPWMRILSNWIFFINTRMKLERCDLSFNKRSWQHSPFFLSQFAYTTALIMMMETINPAIRVMDTFHAVAMFYRTGTVHQLLCGTVLKVDATTTPLPVTHNIYRN